MIHLHTHSHYSVLDGMGTVEEIVNKAKAMKAPAVAITDHASISAMPDLFKYCKEAEIKPIVGCEFYAVQDVDVKPKKEKRIHVTAWAKDWVGVQSIMALLTKANQQFHYRPRINYSQMLELEHCCIGTACAIGLLSESDKEAEAHVWYLKQAFKDDFYLEIMPHSIMVDGVDIQEICNVRAVRLATRCSVKLLATNDAHYVNKEDSYTHEIMLAIQTGKAWTDPKRWKFTGDEFYMKSVDEMCVSFEKLGMPTDVIHKAITGTVDLAKKIDIQMPNFQVNLPDVTASDQHKALVSKVIVNWNEFYPTLKDKATLQVYTKRLIYESEVIGNLGIGQYFLIVEDIISEARRRGILVGPGRGSSAGSLICYLLGITQVDPIKHGLYFERFLNPDRIDLPDIDVDFEKSRRAEVIGYITDKYGADNTANINTFGKLTVKNAFKDVAKVFGVNFLTANSLGKQVEDEESFDKVPDLVKFKGTRAGQNIISEAIRLSGRIRQVGKHACGYIISSKPLRTVSVLEKRKDAKVINWDMAHCEDFGLLKVDVLGLATLSILGEAQRLLEKQGIDIDFSKIPLEDPQILEAFNRGEGAGVFQFENSGMQSLLRAIPIEGFETVTATTALFRPGSLGSGETERYKKIARGEEYETYDCEELRPMLKATKGVMVYQEQIMRIFNQLGGFTWAESDKMRKIIGKKLGADEFNKHKTHFVDGCKAKGIDSVIAETLFVKMGEFAKYSFNKSHAVAYTMISWWCMYMKVHHPTEFITAYLSYTTKDDDGNLMAIVREAKRLKIKIHYPDINVSERTYKILGESEILAPLGIIKGVGAKAVENILDARKAGSFLSLPDFEDRVTKRVVNKRIKSKLIDAGAFSGLGYGEPDQEKREKAYAELIPIYDDLPTIPLYGAGVSRSALKQVHNSIRDCADTTMMQFIKPVPGVKPNIMIVNNPVKNETEHFQNNGSRFFLKTMGDMGFKPSNFYYTSPIKCKQLKPSEPDKACVSCADWLKSEIAVVQPKLIVCFVSKYMQFFGADKKARISAYNGQVIYNKAMDAYILFSYSPQYAYFQEEILDKYMESMEVLRTMIEKN